jgi:hypothetical protein
LVPLYAPQFRTKQKKHRQEFKAFFRSFFPREEFRGSVWEPITASLEDVDDFQLIEDAADEIQQGLVCFALFSFFLCHSISS